jgi:hypothetical protein
MQAAAQPQRGAREIAGDTQYHAAYSVPHRQMNRARIVNALWDEVSLSSTIAIVYQRMGIIQKRVQDDIRFVKLL